MNILKPSSISLKDMLEEKHLSLSPQNYRKIAIKNPHVVKISDLLDENSKYNKGTEVGGKSYVEFSTYKFIRNSNVSKLSNIVDLKNSLSIKPNDFSVALKLNNEDILLATDANVSDTNLFIQDSELDSNEYMFSSGLVRVNPRSDIDKFFLLSLLKDDYFKEQLEAMTPKGSTIRHSKDFFLKCLVPIPSDEQMWIVPIISNLMKNICYMEAHSSISMDKIFSYYENILNLEVEVKETRISSLLSTNRLDAGLYSYDVKRFFARLNSIESYSLKDLGYKIRRGVNLAKRDLGRSLKTDVYRKNYYRLVYPSDISENGYINKITYLGTASKIWFLEEKDILFSAEGNVGKTFTICDANIRFTTNFHGIIITPITKEAANIEDSIFISTFLFYMKKIGIIDKISVGGQGGSFATNYWDILQFPELSNSIKQSISILYHNPANDFNPIKFNSAAIQTMGVYQINEMRIVCLSLITSILTDLKNNKLQNEIHYANFIS